jgi:hypothetical protein
VSDAVMMSQVPGQVAHTPGEQPYSLLNSDTTSRFPRPNAQFVTLESHQDHTISQLIHSPIHSPSQRPIREHGEPPVRYDAEPVVGRAIGKKHVVAGKSCQTIDAEVGLLNAVWTPHCGLRARD